ncbi:MAG: 30S ribosomal protein S12 methylthiotransferase RimO [Bacteroidales bacterium]|jgi:ribosomal protein S12 methylthiotransferase|nr:30S ribosomal protein S12 methylthiotransferase RimO [Bacteroidales bacterium]
MTGVDSTKINQTDCEINIITLGCSKNLVDSEQLAAQLEQNGFRITYEAEQPLPVTIINTCGFIEDAKMQSIETILACAEQKTTGEIKILIVFGCLSERYVHDLRKEIPELDAVFGVNSLPNILSYLNARVCSDMLTVRKISTPAHYAYLKISEGCSHRCAFCAIPQIRGKQVSKPVEVIRDEALVLTEQGVKEIILVAQDLTHYGYDIYKKRQLFTLLEELLKIKNIGWLRLHYLYPNFFQTDILELMKEYPQLCNYLDIPVQHIHDEILEAMNRNITGDQIRRLFDTIRNKIPSVAIRTSVIVGFPGERKKHFNQLRDFLQESQLDRVGIFTYSHEENTPAFKLKETVSRKEKENRKEELMLVQQHISLQKNRQKTGQTIKTIIDKQENEHYTGRTEFDSPEVDNTVIVLKQKEPLRVGDFYNVKISSAEDYDLTGTVCSEL